jgi:hypothetical protein
MLKTADVKCRTLMRCLNCSHVSHLYSCSGSAAGSHYLYILWLRASTMGAAFSNNLSSGRSSMQIWRLVTPAGEVSRHIEAFVTAAAFIHTNYQLLCTPITSCPSQACHEFKAPVRATMQSL